MKTVIYISLFTWLFFSCKKDQNSNNNPANTNSSIPVNVYLTVGTPQFMPLNIVTGNTYVNGGKKGILVYRKSQTEFLAFERNCPYDGNNISTALIEVQADQITLIDSVCGSKFLITDGSIMNGPSTYPLWQYYTSFDGTTLHIFN